MSLKLSPNISEETAQQDYTHRLVFRYSDIPASVANNTATTWNVATLPAGTIIFKAVLIMVTAFQDASDTAFNSDTVSLGDTGSATRYFSAVEFNVNGTEVPDTIYSTPYLYTASDTLILTLNSMTAKSVSNLDVGTGLVLLQIGDHNRAAVIDSDK